MFRPSLAAKLDLQTTDDDLEVEIPVAVFADIIATIANAALESGRQQNLPTGDGEQAPHTAVIKATSVMLIQEPNGVVNFVFRVGALNIAFPFDPQDLAKGAPAMTAALQAAAATDKARRGPL